MCRRRCCCRNCVIFADDFNRAASTDLGTDWTERSGDWSIASYRLREAGNSGAIVICNTPYPNGRVPQACIVTVDLPDFKVGDVYRVIIHYVDDNNYDYGQLERLSSWQERIKVGRVSGGVDTLVAIRGTTLGMDSAALKVCAARDTISAHYATEFCWGILPSDNGGRKVGLGNWSTNSIDFDNFSFEKHKLTLPLLACKACICTCDGYGVDKNLVGTIHNVTSAGTGTGTGDGTCVGCLEGETVDLIYDYDDHALGAVWKGSMDLSGGIDCEDDIHGHNDFELWCGAAGLHLQNFEDWVLLGPADSGIPYTTVGGTPTSGSCKPFSLTFKNLAHILPPIETPTCYYDITITEMA